MTFQEFWDKWGTTGILELTEDALTVLSKPLPDEVYDKYELGELVTEFVGHHEFAKRFTDIERFGKRMEEHHPELWAEDGDYIIEPLIRYYIYLDKPEKLEEQVERYFARSFDAELFFISFEQLVFHGYVDLANRMLDKVYENPTLAYSYTSAPEIDFGIPWFYLNIEPLARASNTQSADSLEAMLALAEKAGLEFREDNLLLRILSKPQTPQEEWASDIQHIVQNHLPDSLPFLLTLRGVFMQYCQAKGIPYVHSSSIFSCLTQYFQEHNPSYPITAFFTLDQRAFYVRLKGLAGDYEEAKILKVLSIWGAPYFLDFLLEFGIIDHPDWYARQLKVIHSLKSLFKKSFDSQLWELSFVHHWQPSSHTSLKEWQKEAQSWRDSFSRVRHPITHSHFDYPYSRHEEYEKGKSPGTNKGPEKLVFGRNDRLTVKYNDGTVKENIKYKHVYQDIENGLCKVMKKS